MSKPLQTLKDLGFSENEASVYLANLVLGSASIQDISKRSGVKRTTIYTLLPRLKNEGLVTEFKKGTKTFLVAENPARLEELVRERARGLEHAMPELKSLYHVPHLKPRVRFFEGMTGIKQVYQDTLEEREVILCIPAWRAMTEALPEFWEWYIKERVKRGIRVRAIAERSTESEHYKQREKEDLRELRFLPADTLPFSTEVNIYGHKVTMVTFGKKFIGVIIEDEEISATWRMVFEVIWKIADTQ